MEKIRKLKKFFKKKKSMDILFQKMMNFLENTFQNIMIDLITFLALLALTVFH